MNSVIFIMIVLSLYSVHNEHIDDSVQRVSNLQVGASETTSETEMVESNVRFLLLDIYLVVVYKNVSRMPTDFL